MNNFKAIVTLLYLSIANLMPYAEEGLCNYEAIQTCKIVLESWGNLFMIPTQWDCNLILLPHSTPTLLILNP